ncbi:helix-turn-helix domain-containing protein [Solimicrobium silvestre]|uniref:Putative transcriptional regulator n=1 Tax=Solimicrobium silvestre TaxID=2099400 RepID=A0A2S9H398_9BURK|nr:helix-turn-helix transcriptional regulator [Solimicrobium silvestre]PRC94336.1 putative transcriptional regulator [Solimicrobium silvestre]
MKIDERVLAQVIGKAISKRRLACNLTQEDVAERLNIGTEAVSRMERGTVMPTVSRLVELADIFNSQVGDLLIESSNRAKDQGKLITNLINALSPKDRAFVVGIVESLTEHLGS